ncbi:hypothetical protein ABN16_07295 [Levilactobacillus koreensis]|uniref:Uncharacterized protein n=1 Tax=Levilactobacillus koreensis TaxID=637971 RepID=A0AAC8UUQ0_9LACO|nr:hypothetical protein ABN16_07295 [Levilactobacillus koreensis]
MEPAVTTILGEVFSWLISWDDPEKRAFFAAFRRAGSPFHRLWAFPMAGVILAAAGGQFTCFRI